MEDPSCNSTQMKGAATHVQTANASALPRMGSQQEFRATLVSRHFTVKHQPHEETFTR